VTGSNSEREFLDLERDLPTSPEDSEVLWRLGRQPVVTDPADANRLRDPYWTLEKALAAPLFSDSEAPFEL
jgi:hypothetical protein